MPIRKRISESRKPLFVHIEYRDPRRIIPELPLLPESGHHSFSRKHAPCVGCEQRGQIAHQIDLRGYQPAKPRLCWLCGGSGHVDPEAMDPTCLHDFRGREILKGKTRIYEQKCRFCKFTKTHEIV